MLTLLQLYQHLYLASVLTIRKIVKYQGVSGTLEPSVRKVRSTVFLLNLGNVAYFGAVFGTALTRRSSDHGQFSMTSFMPIVLSVYSPVVYTLLTKGVFHGKTRV